MKYIESDIIKVSKFDKVQNYEGRKELIKNDIVDSLLLKLKDDLSILVNDETIEYNHPETGYWDEYQFKAYILTEEEFNNLNKQ